MNPQGRMRPPQDPPTQPTQAGPRWRQTVARVRPWVMRVVAVGILSTTTPLAVVMVWLGVTRQFLLLSVTYGVWIGSSAVSWWLYRQYERRREEQERLQRRTGWTRIRIIKGPQ